MKTLKGGDENNKFSAYTAYHQTDKGPMGKVVNGSLDVIDCDHQRLFLLIVWWELRVRIIWKYPDKAIGSLNSDVKCFLELSNPDEYRVFEYSCIFTFDTFIEI